MQLIFGLTSIGQFFVSAEARILMPFGLETLRWTTHFDTEAQFLSLVVVAPLTERDMALVLVEAIRATSGVSDAPYRAVEIELNEEQFYALGLDDGECLAFGSETAAHEL